jgi:hypothetical protein
LFIVFLQQPLKQFLVKFLSVGNFGDSARSRRRSFHQADPAVGFLRFWGHCSSTSNEQLRLLFPSDPKGTNYNLAITPESFSNNFRTNKFHKKISERRILQKNFRLMLWLLPITTRWCSSPPQYESFTKLVWTTTTECCFPGTCATHHTTASNQDPSNLIKMATPNCLTKYPVSWWGLRSFRCEKNLFVTKSMVISESGKIISSLRLWFQPIWEYDPMTDQFSSLREPGSSPLDVPRCGFTGEAPECRINRRKLSRRFW